MLRVSRVCHASLSQGPLSLSFVCVECVALLSHWSRRPAHQARPSCPPALPGIALVPCIAPFPSVCLASPLVWCLAAPCNGSPLVVLGRAGMLSCASRLVQAHERERERDMLSCAGMLSCAAVGGQRSKGQRSKVTRQGLWGVVTRRARAW